MPVTKLIMTIGCIPWPHSVGLKGEGLIHLGVFFLGHNDKQVVLPFFWSKEIQINRGKWL